MFVCLIRTNNRMEQILDYNAQWYEKHRLRDRVLRDLHLRQCTTCSDAKGYRVMRPSVYPIYFQNTHTHIKFFLCSSCMCDAEILLRTYLELVECVDLYNDYDIHNVYDLIHFIEGLKRDRCHGYTF